MKKRSKKSNILILFTILFLTSIAQFVNNEGPQNFTLDGSDVNNFIDTQIF